MRSPSPDTPVADAAGDGALTRRALLGAVGIGVVAAAVAACTSDPPQPGPTTSGSSGAGSASGSPESDAALRAEVAEQESGLVARYAAAVAAYPDLAERLAVGDRHTSYVAAVAAGSTPAPTETAPVPARAVVVERLQTAESRAARQRAAQCGRAQDPELARVLALVGAGCAAAAADLEADR